MEYRKELKDRITSTIKRNGNHEITGPLLQSVLLDIVSTLSEGAQFAGAATPSTDPGTPNGPVFYIAAKRGMYTNFGSGMVHNLVIFRNTPDGTWVKDEIDLSSFGLLTGEDREEMENIIYSDLATIQNHVQALDDKVTSMDEIVMDKVNRKLEKVDKRIDDINASKQDKLTPGAGVEIVNGVLNVVYDMSLYRICPNGLPAAPAKGDENKIHLVPSTAPKETNIYTEYLYVDGKWEKFGEFKADIDLSGYATKEELEEVDGKFSGYATKEELEEVDGKFSGYATKESVTSAVLGLESAVREALDTANEGVALSAANAVDIESLRNDMDGVVITLPGLDNFNITDAESFKSVFGLSPLAFYNAFMKDLQQPVRTWVVYKDATTPVAGYVHAENGTGTIAWAEQPFVMGRCFSGSVGISETGDIVHCILNVRDSYVVDDVETDNKVLPLSARQGMLLDEDIKRLREELDGIVIVLDDFAQSSIGVDEAKFQKILGMPSAEFYNKYIADNTKSFRMTLVVTGKCTLPVIFYRTGEKIYVRYQKVETNKAFYGDIQFINGVLTSAGFYFILYVQDTLTSAQTTLPLSANQGRLLNEKIGQTQDALTKLVEALGFEGFKPLEYTKHFDGYIMYNNLQLVSNTNFTTTHPIDMHKGDVLRISGFYNASYQASIITQIDSDGNPQSVVLRAYYRNEYIYVFKQDMKVILSFWNNCTVTLGRIAVLAYDNSVRRLLESTGEFMFNENTGYYEINGLTDVTERQALDIYHMGNDPQISTGQYAFYTSGRLVRTNMRPKGMFNTISIAYQGYLFYNQVELEYVLIGNCAYNSSFGVAQGGSLNIGSSMAYAFYNCKKLKTIQGTLICVSATTTGATSTSFIGCTSLETVTIRNLRTDISFADSPKLSKASLLYLLQNCSPSSPIGITLHSDVYNMALEDADIQDALENLSNVSLIEA